MGLGASALAHLVPPTAWAADADSPAPNAAIDGGSWVAIHPCLDKGDELEASFLADGKPLGKLQFRDSPGIMRREPALKFQWPKGATKLAFEARLTSAKGKSRTFKRTMSVFDMGPFTSGLYDESLEFDQRLGKLTSQMDQLIKQTGGIDYKGADLISMKPQLASAAAQIAAFESKNRLKLPQPVHALLRNAVTLGDCYFTTPKNLGMLSEAVKEWGDPFDKLPKRVQERYSRSVAVFFEVGDGMGALAWDPQGVTAGEPGNGRLDTDEVREQPGKPGEGVWFWMHEEKLFEPELLLNSRMQPASASQALVNAVQCFALDTLADDVRESRKPAPDIIFDTSNPLLHLQMFVENTSRMTLWQRSYEGHGSLNRLPA